MRRGSYLSINTHHPSQYAAEVKAPVCWLDCDVLTSPVEALGAIGEFLVNQANDDALARAMSGGGAQPMLKTANIAASTIIDVIFFIAVAF